MGVKKLNILKKTAARTNTKNDKGIQEIPPYNVFIKKNIRMNDEVAIDKLKASIKEVGLIQPITVYTKDDKYFCLVGHRRLLAYKALYEEDTRKYGTISCIIREDNNRLPIQLTENIQREDIKAIELYRSLSELKAKGFKNKEVGNIIGRTEVRARDLILATSIISSDKDYEELLSNYNVTIDHFLETKQIKDKKTKISLLKKRAKGQLTRTQLRRAIKKETSNTKKDTGKERNHKYTFGTIKGNKQAGFIKIQFTQKDNYDVIEQQITKILNEYNRH